MPRSDASSISSSLSSNNKNVGSGSGEKARSSGRLKAPIASIPDMRFEQSFLASIRGFVHEVDAEDTKKLKEKRGREQEGNEMEEQNTAAVKRDLLPAGLDGDFLHDDATSPEKKLAKSRSHHGEPEVWLGRLRIEWWPLLYMTVRDQLLSPIVQGAVFGLGGLALGNVRSYLIARRQMQQQQRRVGSPPS